MKVIVTDIFQGHRRENLPQEVPPFKIYDVKITDVPNSRTHLIAAINDPTNLRVEYSTTDSALPPESTPIHDRPFYMISTGGNRITTVAVTED